MNFTCISLAFAKEKSHCQHLCRKKGSSVGNQYTVITKEEYSCLLGLIFYPVTLLYVDCQLHYG